MTKQRLNRKRIVARLKRLMLPAVLCLLVIALIVQGCIIYFLRDANQKQSNQMLGVLIIKASENLNVPLPIDAISGQVYIAQAKITLPQVPNDLDRLLYAYDPSVEQAPEELHIVSQSQFNNAETPLFNIQTKGTEMFNYVPRLQACARGVRVTFSQANGYSGETYEGSKTLSDGRIAYFYSEQLCPNVSLLNYAKQLDSYKL